jgi:hypothetical protein
MNFPNFLAVFGNVIPVPMTQSRTITAPGAAAKPRAALPTFLSACDYEASRISSACECVVQTAEVATVVDVTEVYMEVEGRLGNDTKFSLSIAIRYQNRKVSKLSIQYRF